MNKYTKKIAATPVSIVDDYLPLKEVKFSQPITTLPGNPTFIGSGRGWEHAKCFLTPGYVRVEWTNLAGDMRGKVKTVLVFLAHVVSAEVAPEHVG